MATDLGVTVIAQQGDMLDYLVWKNYGRQDSRRVEQVLDHPRNDDLHAPHQGSAGHIHVQVPAPA
ncbi:MAG: tail protein X [Hyphomicrobium sp.]|uniref:tail protein X n=1 Tax=Hyphomicrobium sp. TaxID=82 RepID=UPI0025C4D41D|nr:tail protein X [Hyphomicrobium sp.]MBZ0210179.1 tail protein X [Hyphomicrobium sp.]